ncbi:MAG: hypothetical protein ACLFWL_05690 [Candidatus Brocadiia bacterium]
MPLAPFTTDCEVCVFNNWKGLGVLPECPKGKYWRLFRRTVRNVVAVHPKIYLSFAIMAKKSGTVSRDNEIVIEGYPRCANSFAEAAFRVAQDGPVRMAQHSHAPAQVLAAVRWHIPTIVVFRNPDDAVVSRMLRSPWLPATSAYYEYAWFYQGIGEVLGNCVLSSFPYTTERFGDIIEAVNQKFDVSYKIFDHSNPAANKRAFELVDALAQKRIGHTTQYSRKRESQYRKREKNAKRCCGGASRKMTILQGSGNGRMRCFISCRPERKRNLRVPERR